MDLKDKLKRIAQELKSDGLRMAYRVVCEALKEIERLEEKHDNLVLLDTVIALKVKESEAKDLLKTVVDEAAYDGISAGLRIRIHTFLRGTDNA